MYCTGGIRCELMGSLLVNRGVERERVFSLKDGVLGYGGAGEQESLKGAVVKNDVDPTRHWEGQLFVFDDRLVVPVDGVVGGQRDRADSR